MVAVIAFAACTTSGKSGTPGTVACAARPPYPPAALPCVKKMFQQIVKNDPQDMFGWYNLGVIAQYAKDSKTATLDYEKAIAIDPTFESALYNLGVIRLNARDYTVAVTLLTRAVAANPKDANAHLNLSRALANLHTVAGNARRRSS